jgi:hypothetical protein
MRSTFPIAAAALATVLASVVLSSSARTLETAAHRAIPGALDSQYAFVDFHARPGPDLVGHSFIVYGALDKRGRVVQAEVAGLYTDEKFYWVGALVPLRGVIGGEENDLLTKSAIVYRRNLTSRQFLELKAAINRIKANEPVWHLLFFNCNDFVGEMANAIGLRRPPSLILPVAYVAMLGALNRSSIPQSDRRARWVPSGMRLEFGVARSPVA